MSLGNRTDSLIGPISRRRKKAQLAALLVCMACAWMQAAPSAPTPAFTAQKQAGEPSGPQGNGWAASTSITPKSTPLSMSAGDDFSVEGWFFVENYPDGGTGKFDTESPMTVFDFLGSGNRLLARLWQGKLQLSCNEGGTWQTLNGSSTLPEGKWHHIAITRDHGQMNVYLNGKLDLVARNYADKSAWERLTIGGLYRGSERRMRGAFAAVSAYANALDLSDINAAKNARASRLVNTHTGQSDPDAWMSFGEFPAVRVQADALHPLIDQLSMSVMVAPWTTADSQDLIVTANERNLFGARIGLFRQVGKDERNLPIYDEGQTLKGLTGTQFQQTARPDGLFDLFALGDDTPYGAKNIVSYRNIGTMGAPRFGEAAPVEIDGKWVSQLANGQSLAGWAVADIDGDGTPDLLLAFGERKFPYLPDGGGIYSGKILPNTGPNRGYDVEGNWLGGPIITRLSWAKGTRDHNGKLTFSDLKKVHYREKDFALQWVSTASERAMNVLELQGQRYLVATGNVDRILAMPITVKDGEIFCEEAKPLLKDNANIHHTYIIRNITVADLDGDGYAELLLDGNPGRVAVLRGRAVGEFVEEAPLQMRGGPLAVDTLAVQERVDYTGDGLPDLIVGDSSGYLSLWQGTDDPMVYQAPVYMKADGTTIQHQAGMSGSLQGPSERRWGYLNPAVGDWKANGTPEIITVDVKGDVTYYARPASPTGHVGDLSKGVPLTLDGKPLRAAWRCKPQILDRSLNFMGLDKPALLYIDWDGDLAVAVPKAIGGTEIERSVKLRYADGKPVVASGPVGAWGRTKFAVADWDGDGVWDVLFGSNRACYPFITQDNPPARSTPMWLKNIGTAQNPVFAPPQLITLKDGSLIDFGVHVAAPAVSDMNGDGTADLLLGGEDGKIYVFPRESLRW